MILHPPIHRSLRLLFHPFSIRLSIKTKSIWSPMPISILPSLISLIWMYLLSLSLSLCRVPSPSQRNIRSHGHTACLSPFSTRIVVRTLSLFVVICNIQLYHFVFIRTKQRIRIWGEKNSVDHYVDTLLYRVEWRSNWIDIEEDNDSEQEQEQEAQWADLIQRKWVGGSPYKRVDARMEDPSQTTWDTSSRNHLLSSNEKDRVRLRQRTHSARNKG